MANSIPTISALRPVLAWQGQPLSSSSSPASVGELLRLTVTAGPQGELLARNEQGLLVNVPSGAAAIGDLLVLRVLATEPRLELQLLERRSGAAGTPAPAQAQPEDTAALRTDQAWLQQRFHGVRQAAQELPAAVAAQWRGRVLAAVLRGGVEQAPTLSGVPAHEGAVARSGGEAIPLQGWQGQALQLRLLNPQAAVWPLPAQEEEAPPRQPAEPEAESAPDESGESGEGLRLGLILSLHGDWVQVVLQWQHGLLLHFSADQAETLQILRGLMPRIAAALAAVPLRLRHCQLSSKPPAVPPLPQAQQSHGLAHSSSGALFRAAAEIAKVLQQA